MSVRILQGDKGGEHRRLEVKGGKAVVVDYLLAGPNGAQHKYRQHIQAELTVADLLWALDELEREARR